MIFLSQPYNPPVLKGIKIYPEKPFRFDFILDKGDSIQPDAELKDESNKLIKYFLASLTVPEKDLWVNLSPYEKERIVADAFGQTEMGQDLLAQDYLLKQITASLLYPEGDTGKRFWQRVYKSAFEKYGTTEIPVETFNKVWIVPEKAVIYERRGSRREGGRLDTSQSSAVAYIVQSRLKVMLESDYFASKVSRGSGDSAPLVNGVLKNLTGETQQLGKEMLRQIVLPVLEKEINEGQNFAQLRQVYSSLILASWYKRKIKESLLARVYSDKNKIQGLNTRDREEAARIWALYVEAFKKGTYNYIKEERDVLSQEVVTRKYVSGGLAFDRAMSVALSYTKNPPAALGNAAQITVQLLRATPPERDIPASTRAQTVGQIDAAMVVENWQIRAGLKTSPIAGVYFSNGDKYDASHLEAWLRKGRLFKDGEEIDLADEFGISVPELRSMQYVIVNGRAFLIPTSIDREQFELAVMPFARLLPERLRIISLADAITTGKRRHWSSSFGKEDIIFIETSFLERIKTIKDYDRQIYAITALLLQHYQPHMLAQTLRSEMADDVEEFLKEMITAEVMSEAAAEKIRRGAAQEMIHSLPVHRQGTNQDQTFFEIFQRFGAAHIVREDFTKYSYGDFANHAPAYLHSIHP